eukprot:8343947-Pyramimonas_sp.AAC.1
MNQRSATYLGTDIAGGRRRPAKRTRRKHLTRLRVYRLRLKEFGRYRRRRDDSLGTRCTGR